MCPYSWTVVLLEPQPKTCKTHQAPPLSSSELQVSSPCTVRLPNPGSAAEPLSPCFPLGSSSFALGPHLLLGIDRCSGESGAEDQFSSPGVPLYPRTSILHFVQPCTPVVFPISQDFPGLLLFLLQLYFLGCKLVDIPVGKKHP